MQPCNLGECFTNILLMKQRFGVGGVAMASLFFLWKKNIAELILLHANIGFSVYEYIMER